MPEGVGPRKPKLSELERSFDGNPHYVSLDKGKLYQTYFEANRKKDIKNLMNFRDDFELYRILECNQDKPGYKKLMSRFEGKIVGPFCYIEEKPKEEKKEEKPIVVK
jgi:hypothetical protein